MVNKFPTYHVLDFSYDNDSGCALTAIVHGLRYYVVTHTDELQDDSKRGKKIRAQYDRLLEQVRVAEQEGEDPGKVTAPLFVQEDEDEDDDGQNSDSAVDMTEPTDTGDHSSNPTTALERWLLRPFLDVFAESKKSQTREKKNVEDWYYCPTYYFYLRIQDGKLQAKQEQNPPANLTDRINALIPVMTLPKYISKLNIPVVQASDLIVLQESSDPGPIHPALVEHNGEKLFLKNVGDPPYQPMFKREIQIMKRIESKGLQHEMRVPLLRALVQFSNAQDRNGKKEVMGLLMNPIEDPTPLTMMLDEAVPEEKRLKWSAESARMVDLLHQHGIIWGDAKGDNFVVDKNDDLWIIDFGGSYTEGWVDPELKETEEGDDQGLRKICNGLEDPVNNTIGEEEETDDEEEEQQGEPEKGTDSKENTTDPKPSSPQKRKASSLNPDVSESALPKKKRKSLQRPSSDSDSDLDSEAVRKAPLSSSEEPTKYCLCNGPERGKMLACDGEKCERKWFHFDCLGIERAPERVEWFCGECEGEAG